MGRRKKIIENLLLEDFVTEGQAIGRQDGKVYFVTNGVPGDVANVLLKKNKSFNKKKNAQQQRQQQQRYCYYFFT